MRTLTLRGLVEEAGTEHETGAILYRTTGYFLERLGLASLDELPELAPFLPDQIEEAADQAGEAPGQIEEAAGQAGEAPERTEVPADGAAEVPEKTEVPVDQAAEVPEKTEEAGEPRDEQGS